MSEMYTVNHMRSPKIIIEIIRCLLSRLDFIRIVPKTILIDEFEAMHVKPHLQKRYPEANIKTTSHELASVDLIFSISALYQQSEPLELLRSFYQKMTKKSLLLFATFGPDTLMELRDHVAADTLPSWIDMHHIGDWLTQLHFVDTVMDMEKITATYDSFSVLSQDLKKIMRNFSCPEIVLHDRDLPVTFEIVFGHAWKMNSPLDEKKEDHEIAIPIGKIRKRHGKKYAG